MNENEAETPVITGPPVTERFLIAPDAWGTILRDTKRHRDYPFVEESSARDFSALITNLETDPKRLKMMDEVMQSSPSGVNAYHIQPADWVAV